MQDVFEKIIEQLVEKHNLVEFAKMQLSAKNSAKVAYDASIEIVKQAAAEYNNCWIPCSERLPKYGEVVMCCCTNGGITVSCITHKYVKLSKIVWFGQHSVIAWQPLPDPYHPKGE